MSIAPYETSMREDLVGLSLRAWMPVFESLERAMLPEVYDAFYRADWRSAQKAAVEAVCADDDVEIWVDVEGEHIAGFAALKLHPEDRMGEIYMIAVEPEFQRRGIARRLTEHAVERFTSEGMKIAMVETGGDEGHAPARRTYESTGFRLLPVARYFKAL